MGGSEKVVYDIARKLDKRLFEVVIISFSDGPVRQVYEEQQIGVYCVEKRGFIDLPFLRKLRKILQEERIHIINAHHFGPFLYLTLASVGLNSRMIYTEHSRWQLEELTPLKRSINNILLGRADAVVAISKQIKDYYVHHLKVGEGKICFIPNGIDIEVFQRRDGRNMRHQLGIKENEKVIGIVANLRPEKNHKLLISAFSDLAKERKDVRLVIVGLDCMNGEVQRFSSESSAVDKILFLGSRGDVPDVIKAFDVFCLPSIYEGMPLTVLEAMAAGVPVVGADVLGINEVIKDNENGLMFPCNEEKELVESLCRLLEDEGLRTRLSRSAKTFVSRYFALDERVRNYETLFRTVCRRS